jgi:intracellular septation protein
VVFFIAFRLTKWFPQQALALSAWIFGVPSGLDEQGAEMSAVMVASLGAIVGTVIQIVWLRRTRRPIKATVWLSAGLVLVFGGLTIWLHNEWFVKWKPTVLYWIFGVGLLGGRWLAKRNFLGLLLSEELRLPDRAWDALLYAWSAFFLCLGVANLYIAYHWATDAWVNFKTFGSMGLTLAFSLVSGWWVLRHQPEAAITLAQDEHHER